jgi:PIN domain nuclease of toxin-antitoxin system
MSFWEVTMLSDRGRITIHEDASSWRQKVLRLGILEIPVTGEIAIAAVKLSNFHSDPADRLITATAMVNGATLLTADRRILRWQSPLRRIDART